MGNALLYRMPLYAGESPFGANDLTIPMLTLLRSSVTVYLIGQVPILQKQFAFFFFFFALMQF